MKDTEGKRTPEEKRLDRIGRSIDASFYVLLIMQAIYFVILYLKK